MLGRLALAALAAVVGVVGVYTAEDLIHMRAGGNPAANRVLADQLAASEYGWTGSQRGCLNTLWRGESGFSQYADTRQTGLDSAGAQVFAYGIPQARPASKLPEAGQPASLGGQSEASAQVHWGLRYIKRTYGDPCAALAFKRAHGNRGY